MRAAGHLHRARRRTLRRRPRRPPFGWTALARRATDRRDRQRAGRPACARRAPDELLRSLPRGRSRTARARIRSPRWWAARAARPRRRRPGRRGLRRQGAAGAVASADARRGGCAGRGGRRRRGGRLAWWSTWFGPSLAGRVGLVVATLGGRTPSVAFCSNADVLRGERVGELRGQREVGVPEVA